MKTATVRQIRNKFPAVLRLVQNGETIAITSRRKIVAALTPPPKTVPPKRAWPGIEDRIKRLLAQPMLKVSGAQILAEDRDRF
jgi:antitoxin (DNA-binding transcriptional repressor) of toxin-antitoxin stability system